MWTAKIQGKNFINGALEVHVDFTDGVKVVTESCIPQDKAGFEYWVKSRLATFNGGTEIDTSYEVNSEVSVVDPEPTPQTQEEIDRGIWFNKFRQMERVQKLVDLGIVLNTNVKVVALRDWLKINLQASYIDYL